MSNLTYVRIFLDCKYVIDVTSTTLVKNSDGEYRLPKDSKDLVVIKSKMSGSTLISETQILPINIIQTYPGTPVVTETNLVIHELVNPGVFGVTLNGTNISYVALTISEM